MSDEPVGVIGIFTLDNIQETLLFPPPHTPAMAPTIYRSFPASIVIISNLLSLAIYVIGAYMMFRIHLIGLILYILYILILEFRLLRGHCVNCFYYEKACAFGKGKMSSLFFKKGDCRKFVRSNITWKDIIPDFLVTIIPLIAGVMLLIMDFEWLILIVLVMLIILGFPGMGLLRGKMACLHCKQRMIGCPAEQLFKKPDARRESKGLKREIIS